MQNCSCTILQHGAGVFRGMAGIAPVRKSRRGSSLNTGVRDLREPFTPLRQAGYHSLRSESWINGASPHPAYPTSRLGGSARGTAVMRQSLRHLRPRKAQRAEQAAHPQSDMSQ
ncbi:MAG: hypothetical protein ACLR8Y_00130 [Alistipes indistinctus]